VKKVTPKKGGGFKTHAMRVTTSSKKHKWRTDPRLIKLIERFAKGKIGLDPCAAKAEKHQFAKVNYSLHNGKDGLKEKWTGFGVVYANPEYARSTLLKFINKGVNEFAESRDIEASGLKVNKTDHLFLLVPARPDTRWFHDVLLKHMTGMCFWKGRLKFSDSDPAPFPSLIIYFGHKPNRFRKLFVKHGWVIINGRKQS